MVAKSSQGKQKLGRPKTPSSLARPHRIVTFVTAWELQQLERVTVKEERSMAAVVHLIIKAHFEGQ